MGLGARPVARSPTDDARERRLFVAVRVPDTVREAAKGLMAAARPAAEPRGRSGLRWVGPDALHLTLRFLGGTPEARVPAAAEAVAEAASATAPFSVTLGRSGAFPRIAAPRTLWLGVEDGAQPLADLAAAVEEALVRRGWPRDDRPFRAHLTLARCEDQSAGRAAAEALAVSTAGLRMSWRVRTLVLYESHLGRGPARYAVLAEDHLGA